MIGHYLLTLTPEQEDRVLIQHMGPVNDDTAAPGVNSDNASLVMVANGLSHWTLCYDVPSYSYKGLFLGDRYDGLCRRFGAPRVNAAVRNRILSNQLRRTLTRQREGVAA